MSKLFYRIVFFFLKRFWPERAAFLLSLSTPDPSAMPDQFNCFYERLLLPFFSKISVDVADEESLKDITSTSTIIYVSQNTGQLEYGFFSYALPSINLPRATVGCGINKKRWFPKQTVLAQIAKEIQPGHIDLSDVEKMAKAVVEGSPSFVSITPSSINDPALFSWRPYQPLLTAAEAAKKSTKPVVIIPLTFMWDKRPRVYKSQWWSALFGEVEHPSKFRKFILFCVRYQQKAALKVGKPILLSSIIADHRPETGAEILRNNLLTYFAAQVKSTKGPPLRPKGWIIDQILDSQCVRTACVQIAQRKNRPSDEVLAVARRFASRMVADINPRFLDLIYPLVNRSLKNTFETIDVDKKGLDQLRELIGTSSVILTPNHLSHADYLIVTYIMYKNNLPFPHVFSGNNLSFWPLGPILRRCGAYFIPRSLKGNELYKTVLCAYLKLLVREGYLQEFYVEGGRSRTGRIKYPKFGMIKMLGEAAKDANKPVVMMPLTITYDKVEEQGSYKEEQKGKEKESEKPSHLLRLQKFMRRHKRRKGHVYLRFGNPVEIKHDSPNDFEMIGMNLIRELSQKRLVTPQAIACMAMLCDPKPTVTKEVLYSRANSIINVAKASGYELSLPLLSQPHDAVKIAIAQMVETGMIAYKTIPYPYYSIDPDQRVELDFVKNTGLDAVFAQSLAAKTKFQARYDAIRKLFKFAMPAPEKTFEDASKGIQSDADEIAKIVEPLFDSAKVVLYIFLGRKKPPSPRKFIKEALSLSKDLLALGEISYPEAVTKSNLSEMLEGFVASGAISPTPKGWKVDKPVLEKIALALRG